MTLVSVLTPTIPPRAALLEQLKLSVAAQTVGRPTWEHLIAVDEDRQGCAKTMNHLAGLAQGEWLLPIADDDLLLPAALERLLEVSTDADVVYGPPLVSGNGATHFFGTPPEIPAPALVRATLWHELGGYDEALRREEDRNLWTRALAAGARFVRIHEPVWVYRFHRTTDGGYANKSYRRGVSA